MDERKERQERQTENDRASDKPGALIGKTFNFLLDIEPNFVLQTANAYARAKPLTDFQRAMLQKIPGEFGGKHERGVLSMAREDNDPNSAESSFSILLGDAPHLDGQYTTFGKLVRGWEVLKKLESAARDDKNTPTPKLEIVRASIRKTPDAVPSTKGPKKAATAAHP